MKPHTSHSEEPITNMSVLFTRLAWLFVGPITMLVLLVKIVESKSGWTTGLDFGFLAVLAVTIVARWLEYGQGSRVTLDGAVATPAMLRDYSIRTALIGVSAWVVGNVLGNHLLK